MARVSLTILIVFYLTKRSETITFERCQLATELSLQGFPRHLLEEWVCLVEGESSRRTHVVGGPNPDGSYDHGLFQINDRFWCSNGNRPGKDCHVRCTDLRRDNITIASRCAQYIFRQHGFHAWVAWTNECRGQPLPDLHYCGL